MDAPLSEQLTAALNSNEAQGVVAADRHGLCLGVRGSGRSAAAGYVKSLVDHASVLGEHPSIVIETESLNIFVHQEHGISTAVFKTATH